MPDLVEDERLANLFLTFRAEAGAELRPPGSDTARRTVRRRRYRPDGRCGVPDRRRSRHRGSSSPLPGPGGPTAAGDPSIFGPTLSSEERDRLGVDALATLGYVPPGAPARRPGCSRPVRASCSAVSAPTRRLTGSVARPSRCRRGPTTLPRSACRRVASTVEWRAPPGSTGRWTWSAGGQGVGYWTMDRPRRQRRHRPHGHSPTSRTRDRAGIAIVLTDPRFVLARHALGSTTAESSSPARAC